MENQLLNFTPEEVKHVEQVRINIRKDVDFEEGPAEEIEMKDGIGKMLKKTIAGNCLMLLYLEGKKDPIFTTLTASKDLLYHVNLQDEQLIQSLRVERMESILKHMDGMFMEAMDTLTIVAKDEKDEDSVYTIDRANLLKIDTAKSNNLVLEEASSKLFQEMLPHIQEQFFIGAANPLILNQGNNTFKIAMAARIPEDDPVSTIFVKDGSFSAPEGCAEDLAAENKEAAIKTAMGLIVKDFFQLYLKYIKVHGKAPRISFLNTKDNFHFNESMSAVENQKTNEDISDEEFTKVIPQSFS